MITRRRLLQITGTLGLTAVAAGCADPMPGSPSLPPGESPAPPVPSSPAAAPPSTTIPPPVVTPVDELCRSAWGAQPARPGGRPHTITRMTLHHTAVVLGDNSNAPARLRQHQRYHQNDKGWIDIAYHVSVDRNGNIYELRDWHLAGDTATEYDPAGHFLVLCEGDFDREEITEAQLHGAALAFAWATQNFHIAPTTLGGHRDFASTSCPGTNLYARLANGEIGRRVDELVAAGPVDLKQFCGPAADAKVAQIEAGR